MPFLQAAREKLVEDRLSPELKVVLEYLLQNGVGRMNPVPIDEILEVLSVAGHNMTYNRFQTTLLAETRSGDIFLGSGPKGVFIIATAEDARAARDFYRGLIQSQIDRIAHLEELAAQAGWVI